MEEREDIIITLYKNEYYNDLVEAGYYSYFDTYLKPYRFKNLLNIDEIKKFVHRTFFLNKEEVILVAYSRKDKKAVGTLTLRKITDRLWGIYSLFVSPEYRGRRIGSSLIEEGIRLLKEKNVEKLTLVIAKSNIPSIKAYTRLAGSGFLHNMIFHCKRIGAPLENDSGKIKVRKFHHGQKKYLWEIFKLCVGTQWCSYLEINYENYLDRIYGPACFEEYGLLSRLAMKTSILMAENRGEIQGYSIPRKLRLFNSNYDLRLFVPISKDFEAICKTLLLKSFRPSKYKRENKFSFVYIGNEETKGRLESLVLKSKNF